MAQFKRNTVTRKGIGLILNALSKKSKIIFTKIESTDFAYSESTNISEILALDSPKQSVLISEVKREDKKIILHSIFNNENLNGGYWIKALGVYAKDESGVEILFSVLVASESDFMPKKEGNNVTALTYDLIYSIENTENITLTIENQSVATAEMLDNEREARIAADKLFLPKGTYGGNASELKKGLEDNIQDIKDNRWRLYAKIIGNTSTNTDLNDIKEVGWYYSASSSNKFTNMPAGASMAFVLYIESISPEVPEKYLVQEYRNFINNEIYRRVKVDGTWFQWQKISDDLSKYEGIIAKKSGFNLDKSDVPVNDTNKLFTAMGAYNLDNKKMNVYQESNVKNYDDLLTDGFYILSGSADSSVKNAPYNDKALVQVWRVNSYVYQMAVGYYDASYQFARCFQAEKKNVKWETIFNSKNARIEWDWLLNKPSAYPPSGHTHDERYYTEAEVDSKLSGKADLYGSYGTQQIGGAYSGNGGHQAPSYVGSGKVRFLMSKEEINGDSEYKDWVYMDTYDGGDVGYVTAFGVKKSGGGYVRAFIMRGKKGNSVWEDRAELMTSQNFLRKVWSGSISGNATVCTLPANWQIAFVQGAWDGNYPTNVTTEILFRDSGLVGLSVNYELQFKINSSNQLEWLGTSTNNRDAICRAVYVI